MEQTQTQSQTTRKFVIWGREESTFFRYGEDCADRPVLEDLFSSKGIHYENLVFEFPWEFPNQRAQLCAPDPAHLREGNVLAVKNYCGQPDCLVRIQLVGSNSRRMLRDNGDKIFELGTGQDVAFELGTGQDVAFEVVDGEWTQSPGFFDDIDSPPPTTVPIGDWASDFWEDTFRVPPTAVPYSPVPPPTTTNTNISTGQLIGVIAFAYVVLAVVLCYSRVKNSPLPTRSVDRENNIPNTEAARNHNNNGSTTTNNNNDDDTDEGLLSTKIAAMSMEERKALYQKTFARKHQEMLLDPAWIVAPGSKDHRLQQEEEEEEEHDVKNDDDDDIHLALESSRSTMVATTSSRRPPTTDDNDNDSCILASCSSTNRHNSTTSSAAVHNILHPYYSKTNKKKNAMIPVVPGLCVICLEPMRAGEKVVFSETSSCPHLFHTDCMVNFLAYNTQQQERNPRTRNKLGLKNSCPTCRQNFVTLTMPSCV